MPAPPAHHWYTTMKDVPWWSMVVCAPVLLSGFWAATVVLITAYVAARVWATGLYNNAWRRSCQFANDQYMTALATYQRDLTNWNESRPARRIEKSSDPLRTAMDVMGDQGGVTFLGLDPHTRAFCTANRTQSVMVLGKSQSGKTSGVGTTSLLLHNGPAVATSTKPDSLFQTAAHRSRLGRCWLFDPSGVLPDHRLLPNVERVRYSLLWQCTSWDVSQKTATSAIAAARKAGDETQQFWTDGAELLLAPLLFAAALSTTYTMADVRHWIAVTQVSEAAAVLETVMKAKGHPHAYGAQLALDNLRSWWKSEEKIKSGYIATAMSALKVYSYESVLRNGLDTNFDPEAFIYSNDTLYIVMPSDIQDVLAPAITPLIDEIVRAAYRRDGVEPFHDSGRPPVMLCLDEAANVAPIRRLPGYLSEGPGQGVLVVAFFQSLSQCRYRWGVEGHSFLDSFGVTIAYGGLADPETTEALSLRCGDEEHTTISRNSNTSTGRNYGESVGTFGSMSGSSSWGESSGSSWGSSEQTTKQRVVSPADGSAISAGSALVVEGPGQWRIVEIAPIFHSPWTAFAHTAHTVPMTVAVPPLPRPLGFVAVTPKAQSAPVIEAPFDGTEDPDEDDF